MTTKFPSLAEFYEQVLAVVLGHPGVSEELMNPDARRRCGAHYTTEENIMNN